MEKYKNIEFGISVEIPHGWSVMPAAWTKTMRLKAAPTSEELALLLSKAQTPFLYIQKPTDNENLPVTTVQFVAKPKSVLVAVGGMKKLLDAAIDQFKIAFPDFQCLEASEEIIVAGLRCGYLKSSMSVLNEHGGRFFCLSELFVIESKRALFMVGMSGSIIDSEYPEAAFKSILRSVNFF